MIRDAFRFLYYNMEHYSVALWGLRLQLEPDYPVVTRFVPGLIRDSVYEWRTYGGMILWAFFITQLPEPFGWFLVGLWGKWSWDRAGHFRSNYLFWKQAYRECPRKSRVQTEYEKWICLETQRLMKTGQGGRSPVIQALDREARRIQEEICAGSSYNARHAPEDRIG